MKQIILDTIGDLVADFVYYDRKEDEGLSIEQLNKAIENGLITIDEIVAEFKKHIDARFKK